MVDAHVAAQKQSLKTIPLTRSDGVLPSDDRIAPPDPTMSTKVEASVRFPTLGAEIFTDERKLFDVTVT